MKMNRSAKLVSLLSLSLALGLSVAVNTEAKSAKKPTITPVSNKLDQNVDIILKSRNSSDLTNYTYAVTKKGNANFRKFLTPEQFAAKYGQSNATVSQIKKYMAKYHLKTTAYKGNLVLSITGKTNAIEKAFHVKLVNKKVDGSLLQTNQDGVNLPKSFSSKIMSITGFTKNAVASKTKKAASMKPAGITKDTLRADTSVKQSEYGTDTSPRKFINRYNVSSLYNSGQNTGQGKTIGIISFTDFNPSDAYTFWKQMGIPVKSNRISINYVDGAKKDKKVWDGYDETTLDVEHSGAVAPQANIRLYTSSAFGATGFFNNVAAANSENKADVLSMSWGLSEYEIKSEQQEKILPKQYRNVMNLLFKQSAVQGISTFIASGDNGAYQGSQTTYSNGLQVTQPSASPYVTSVGGTTLPNTYDVNGKTVEVKKERAWGDTFLYPEIASSHQPEDVKGEMYMAGGGGGFSTLNGTPAYQRGFSGTQTFRAEQIWNYNKHKLTFDKTPKVITGQKEGRNLPDVSANTDAKTGYKIYISKPNNGGKGKWVKLGGTSIAAPQIAAAGVLISQKVGSRFGLWNPSIYGFAKSSDSPFTTLDSATDNTNLYYTGQPGKLYNQATGLGTIDFGKLGQSFENQ